MSAGTKIITVIIVIIARALNKISKFRGRLLERGGYWRGALISKLSVHDL